VSVNEITYFNNGSFSFGISINISFHSSYIGTGVMNLFPLRDVA